MNSKGAILRWPLFLIGVPAAVAIWSGWVGLGTLAGFGVIHPLPGIWESARLNTAICLPLGVEAYGAYSLRAWLVPGSSATAKTFAKRSAIGSLLLGMAGQVVYHLLAAAHYTRAPWPVVVAVACMPVITLGFAAALAHLLHVPVPEAYPDTGTEADTAPGTPTPEGQQQSDTETPVPAAVPAAVSGVPATPDTPDTDPDTPVVEDGDDSPLPTEVVEPFLEELARGEVPGIRRIRDELSCGQPRAQRVQRQLAALVEAKHS